MLGKRTRSAAPSAGPGGYLKKRSIQVGSFIRQHSAPATMAGPSYPPGFFRHAVPQRVGVQRRRYPRRRYQRGRFTRKYPRPLSGRIAMRPNIGSHPPLEVHRKYFENTDAVLWPKHQAGLQTPSSTATYVPIGYQLWNRGVADNQFTGSKVTLKNISVMMQLHYPAVVPTPQNIPYRFRILVGWCKQNTVLPISSSVAAGDLPNGIVLNETKPDQATPLYDDSVGAVVPRPAPLLTVQTAIDDTNYQGLHQTEIAYPKNKFMILSDRTMNITADAFIAGAGAGAGDQRVFRDNTMKFNFTCNKQLKLVACTTQANADAGAEWFTPANVPGDWIPFISVACLNKSSFDNVNQLPTFKFTENTFFLDN